MRDPFNQWCYQIKFRNLLNSQIRDEFHVLKTAKSSTGKPNLTCQFLNPIEILKKDAPCNYEGNVKARIGETFRICFKITKKMI